jgi:glyoxylase-like metal-dependent hydrolase (beta-lactamase superfamily II)
VFRPVRQGPLTRILMAPTFLGRPVRQVSAYVFEDLLIDTGPPPMASRLVEWVRGSGVRRVVLTHHHEDHIGGAAALQEELGLPVLAPADARTLRNEGLSVADITRRLLGREELLTYASLGDFSKRNLIRALVEGGGLPESTTVRRQ